MARSNEFRISMKLLGLAAVLMGILVYLQCGCSGPPSAVGDGLVHPDSSTDCAVVDGSMAEGGSDAETPTCDVVPEPCSFKASECKSEGTSCFQCTCKPGGWAVMFAGCVDVESAGGKPCSTWYYRRLDGGLCKLELDVCPNGDELWGWPK